MGNIGTYWEIANRTIAVINMIVEGFLVYQFVKPFIHKESYCVGLSYSASMPGYHHTVFPLH